MGHITWIGAKANQRKDCPLAKHIGQQLFKVRQKQQITMKTLGKTARLSPAFICQIENGQSLPTAETLWKLSQTLGVPVGYWFKGFNDEQPI